MKTTLAIAALGLSSLVGCTLEREYVDPNANQIFNGDRSGEGNVNVQNATIRGDIGPIKQFDGPASGYGYDDSEFGSSNITLDTQNDRGTGLVMIYLDRSIHDLPEGETVLTGSNDNIGGNYVQLCSDSPDASIHFDGIAEEVKIVVNDNGNVRNVNVEATITDGYDGSSYAGAAPTIVSSQFAITR